MQQKKLKVAFNSMDNNEWIGGVVYQNNLLESLSRYAPDIDIILLLNKGGSNNLPYHQRILIDGTNVLATAVYSITRLITKRNLILYNLLFNSVDGGVDITFNIPITFKRNAMLGRKIATLFWIPDFQHIHYPGFFTEQEIKNRNINYKRMAKHATIMVLSSNDALKDFKSFAPEYADKARVMNFVSYVPDEIYLEDPRRIVNKYNLPEIFFYLPNQFWKHKNHGVVFEALKLLKEKNILPNVVCTGNACDYRNPEYFGQLTSDLDQWGIKNQVYLLGIIPHEDVYRLYRQACCVINPSLFEGWSTSVEEAKSIGKRILLSDIAVHREQSPPSAVYFDPYDPLALSQKMREIWDESLWGPDAELEQKAKTELPLRMKKYAETFKSIASEAKNLVDDK